MLFFCFCFPLQRFLLFICCIFHIYRQYLPILLDPFHLSFKKFGAFYHPHCLLSSLFVLFAPVLFFSVVFISQLKFSFVSSFSLTLSAHFHARKQFYPHLVKEEPEASKG